MDILLVNPDYNDRRNIPWGPLNLGSYLTKVCGLRVTLVDACVHGEEGALKRIKELLPETGLVGLGFMSIDAAFAKRVAELVRREKPSCRIIAGGPHAMLLPEQTAEYEGFDFVAYTEAETTVARLIEELRKPEPDFASVPGLVYRDGGGMHRTERPRPVPFYRIDYDLLDESVRAGFSRYMQVFTGYGCSFKCTFCFNSICGSAWRGRPMEEVFAELDDVVARYNPATIYFRDENFFHDQQRVLEFIRLYRAHGFTFKWRALCRASYFRDNYMNADFLRELASVGCVCLKYGFESGSDRVLRSLRKGILVHHIERTYEAHRQVPEIELVGNFMLGMPGEEPEDYYATLNLVARGLREVPGMSVVGPHYYRIYPGGALYNRLVEEFGYVAPASFDEWVSRYSEEANRGVQGGFADTRIRYPWVPASCEFLARNASHFIRFAQRDYIAGQPPYKRWLFWPLHSAIRARLRHGRYGGLLDLRLALFLQEASVWGLLQNSSLYRWLRGTSLYGTLRSTAVFGQLRRLFQRASSRAA